VLRRIVSRSLSLRVVGEASDAQQLVGLVEQLRPDVIVMDIAAQVLDGYHSCEFISARFPTPVVVITTSGEAEFNTVPFRAASVGVVGLFQKPRVPEGWKELAGPLRATLRQVGGRSPETDHRGAGADDLPPRPGLDYVAIGGSTGGPGATLGLLRELGSEFPAAVAVVQHIAEGFDRAFADWLREELPAVDVAVAAQGESLDPGVVRIAPIGSHLLVDNQGVLRLDFNTPPRRGHRPSVDLLFRSFLDVGPDRVAAVLLSGMGDDGVAGMRELREAGALTVAQDAASCAVYGMPRVAVEKKAAEVTLSPSSIGRLLARSMARGQD
jgi:two-component system chemotaxis response regulator CheB